MTYTLSPAQLPPSFPVDSGFAAIGEALFLAGHTLVAHLERGCAIDAAMLRAAMEGAFGGSDAEGAWDWKQAYDACEAAQILFLRKYAKAIFHKSGSSAEALAMIEKVAALLPTHTRRSETSQALQQFRTPAGLAFVARFAASIRLGELVLEPYMGRGATMIAALMLGRSAIGCEIDEHWADESARRLEQEIAQGRLFEPAEIVGPKQPALMEVAK